MFMEKEEFSVIGKRLPRIDAYQKATGKAKFGVDIKLPQMLYGAIFRSKYPHAKILNLDISKAARLTGVKGIITAKDAPVVKFRNPTPDDHLLASDKVYYIGDKIAAVAAVEESIAQEALELIKVDYEELPAVFDPESAMQPQAPEIHPGKQNIASQFAYERGNIKKGFEEADIIFEDRFETHSVNHCSMETHDCIADFDYSGRLTIWATIQNLFNERAPLANLFNIPEINVRIIQPFVGGAFGGKGGTPPQKLLYITALLSKKTGRPVKISYSREEEFSYTRSRIPTIIYLKMGAKRDGRIVAKEVKVIGDSGASAGQGPSLLLTVAQRIDSAYRIPNIKAEGFLVYTNKTPAGQFRGLGNPQGTFAVESMLDMIAKELRIDPMEIRLKNATQTGDTTVHGWVIKSCGLSECIKKSAQAIGWQVKKYNKLPWRGVGMACMIHVSGKQYSEKFAGANALVKIEPDGKALVITGEGEIGQGATTTLVQIAAEELGLSMEDVMITEADTSTTPYALGAGADRLTFISGNAVKLAAHDAKVKLLEIAGKLMEVDPEALEIRDKNIYVKDSPDRYLSIAEVAQKAHHDRKEHTLLVGVGRFNPDTVPAHPKTKYGNVGPSYIFAVQAAEVEVDPATGRVDILNFVAAHDLGRAINPMAAEGQIEGGVSQGIGYTFSEELKGESGRIINPNFSDYKIPTAHDMPPIKSILVESIDPEGPFGAKGVGEPGLVPTAPAIANAIYDACGVRIRSLPINPEKILSALKREKNNNR